MLKIKYFLKPFLVAISLAIILLFVQAICDLILPKLMSDIVNVGIQQGGIEDKTPQVISEAGMKFSKTFMSSEEQKLLDKNYTLKSASEPDAGGRPLADSWPNAAGGKLYVLNAGVSETDLAAMNDAFGTATWTMMNFMKQVGTTGGAAIGEATSSAATSSAATSSAAAGSAAAVGGVTQGAEAAGNDAQPEAATTDISTIDLTQIYQLQPILDKLPQSQLDEARNLALSTDLALREQSGTMLIAAFYRELGANMDDFELGYILRIGLIMLLVTLVSGVATIAVGYISSRVGAGVARDIREAIFAKVSQFSHAEFNRFSTASLITRTTNDVTMMQMLLSMGIRMICSAPIMGIGGIIMALQTSLSMSWIIAVGVIVLVCVMGLQIAIVMPRFKIMQKLIDRLNLVARETLSGLLVIRAFSRDDFEKQRFDDANLDLTKVNLFVNRIMVLLMPIMMLLMNGLSILIIWVGAHQVAASQMQVGDMMAYMQYVMQIMMSFMMVAGMFMFIPRASVSAGRIAEVLEAEPSIVDPATPLPLDANKRGLVEFKNVSFRYEGAESDALHDISFTVNPGQTVAFIGPTGSGKSTILNLVPRFYDASSGEIKVEGVDVRQAAQAELRKHIGYVPQQSILMGGTIESNIAYGRPEESLPADEMAKLTEVAQATEFIQEKDEGYAFAIAQGGSNVSGGQRQRLSIARALAVHPDIYLFDDSFSALDFATDAALRKALRAYTKESTLFIVAQRIGTIMDADIIHVIEEGAIVGSGTHAELLKTCPQYREIAESQLSIEELDGAQASAIDAAASASLTEGGEQ